MSVVGERLADVTILTSNSTSTAPPQPSLSSNVWVARNYREKPYAMVGEIDFRPAITARHIAVYSANTEALSLAEVDVYGRCD